MIMCRNCDNGRMINTYKEVYIPEHDIYLPLYSCNNCDYKAPESDLFGMGLIMEIYYSEEVDEMIKEGMSYEEIDYLIGDQAYDSMEHEYAGVIEDVVIEVIENGFCILKKIALDFYEKCIDDFIEDIYQIHEENFGYEEFNQFSYCIRLQSDIEKGRLFEDTKLKKVYSPINWYGGKYYMRSDIISLFPKHIRYCEVFGGAAHILFAKDPSPQEVYNDIHEGLYTFFKVLRNDKMSARLIEKLKLTLYSRREFFEALDWIKETDEVEKARKFYTVAMQSFNSNCKTWSKSNKEIRNNMCGRVSKWLGNIDGKMASAVERLRHVEIENLDFLKCIDEYDSPTTLFYLDPPYVEDTRRHKKSYKYEMTDNQHKELVVKLLNIEGMAILSGYDNDIYEKLVEYGWRKVSLGEKTKAGSSKKAKGEEIVWLNYDEKGRRLAKTSDITMENVFSTNDELGQLTVFDFDMVG